MADTFTHGAVTGWTAKAVGMTFGAATGIELFDANWYLAAVLGATTLDMLTDPFVWFERDDRFGQNRPFIVSMKYDELLTEELRILEAEGAKSIQWYHLLHSYWVAIATTLVIAALWDPYIASGWIAGYFPHIALDEGTHEKLSPFLPFRWRCFTTKKNWWEWRLKLTLRGRDLTIAWNPHVYYISVPASFIGVYHICQLYGIAP